MNETKYQAKTTESDTWNRPYASYILCPLLLVLTLMPWGTGKASYARAGLLPLCSGVLFAWLVEWTVDLTNGNFYDTWVNVGLFLSHTLPFIFALFLWRPALPIKTPVHQMNALNVGSIVATLGVGSLVCLVYFAAGVMWPYNASQGSICAGYIAGVCIALLLGQYYPSPRTGQEALGMNFNLELKQPNIPPPPRMNRTI